MLTPEQTKKIEGIKDPLIKQKYIKYFQLPEDLRKSIFAVETADKIREIGSIQNKLNTEQIGSLAYVVGGVLLGDIQITDFVRTIEEKCKIDTHLAQKIARQVAQEIFLPIKESLKKVHQGIEIPEKEAPLMPQPIKETPEKSETPPSPKKEDVYKEQITQKDVAGPAGARPVEPRLEGNIVDLKSRQSEE